MVYDNALNAVFDLIFRELSNEQMFSRIMLLFEIFRFYQILQKLIGGNLYLKSSYFKDF